MWQRYTLYDVRVICHYLGVLIQYTGLAMIIPFVTALVFSEWEPASRYLVSIGLALCLGSALRMLRIESGRLNRQQAIAVTVFAWIVVASVAAVPLSLTNHYASYGDALFDSIALFTTTGLSIMSDPDHLSIADNMWRFAAAYAGGVGLIVVGMSFGLFGRVSDSSLYESEGRSDHVLPNVVETARFIALFSASAIAVASVVLAIALALHGIEPVRAALQGIWLSIAGFMTVGMTAPSTNIVYYHSTFVELVLMVLMVMGSINFAVQAEILRGRVGSLFRDTEIKAGIVWTAVMLVIFIFALSASNLFSSLPDMLRTGLFNFLAAVTTTGFTKLTSNQLTSIVPSGALLVFAIAMAVGGSSGSTAGGVKLKRVAVIALSAYETLKSVASPQSARLVTNYHHIGRRRLGEDEVKSAMTVFIMFVLVYIVGALVGVAYGYDAVSAVTESIAMASNGGISTGITTADMPALLKAVYAVEMWAGRLEYVTLLAVGIKIFVSVKPRMPERLRQWRKDRSR